MDSVEKIGTVIPKLKYQLIFLKERESLLAMFNSDTMKTTDQFSTTTSVSTVSMPMDQSRLVDDPTYSQSTVDRNDSIPFPDKYIIPQVPNSLLKDIEDGLLNKFGPHYSNRQILIDAIVHDLIEQYKLL